MSAGREGGSSERRREEGGRGQEEGCTWGALHLGKRCKSEVVREGGWEGEGEERERERENSPCPEVGGGIEGGGWGKAEYPTLVCPTPYEVLVEER